MILESISNYIPNGNSSFIQVTIYNNYHLYTFNNYEVRVLLAYDKRGKYCYAYNYNELREIAYEIEEFLSNVFLNILRQDLAEFILDRRRNQKYVNVFYLKLKPKDLFTHDVLMETSIT